MCGQGQEDLGAECVNEEKKLFGLQPEWAIFRDIWGEFIYRANI